jgi:hypothetical protein
VTERQGRRRKQLPNKLRKIRRYCKLKKEALMLKTCFARHYGPIRREKTTA